jgi:di/tricarboxylate transporter
MPDPDTKLAAGDALIVEGNPADLEIIRGLQGLRIERDPDIRMADLDTGPVSLVEVVLSPYSTLPTNKTLRELHFREKYGLSVLAIWRGERAYRTNLGDMTIRFGDALLLYGPREKIRVFSQEPDFLVLHEESPVERRYQKASVAALLMIAAILAALVGWLPISIATVIGATLMVAAGCLDMDQAYRFIEWKAVFLIAAMLPLGTAMHETGAARFLARGVIAAIGGLGPMAVLAGLFITTALATQFMPNPVVAVLMAPIALTAADKLAVTPYAFMMGVAFAASSSFLSPVGHATNVLVMGPGGYRFIDYVKVGLPLTIILLIVTLLVVPLLWPFAS